ncbi:hepatocyte growth factor receptor precursor [Planoprotostelium fungivorum]|uniref:Hepatocyte growth factor receptor n=1 Tax=Planoprotostelium fungivorum TaxID=1890364 RepID=A0A2P6MPF4_9EUKA|nr:hepatocyte growth factor receptor precursor [Planoprotostelium fungivorum]
MTGCIVSVYLTSLRHCWIKTTSSNAESFNSDRILVYPTGILATDVVVIDDNYVNFTLPAWGGQNVMLTVYATDDIENTDSRPLYTYPAPIITSVTPNYIPSNGSLSTITGQNLLSGRTAVSAGGYSCSVQRVSSSQIECLWSAGQGGPYSVSVNVQGLTVTDLNVSFMAGPYYVISPGNATSVLSIINDVTENWPAINIYFMDEWSDQTYPFNISIQVLPGTNVSVSMGRSAYSSHIIQSTTPLDITNYSSTDSMGGIPNSDANSAQLVFSVHRLNLSNCFINYHRPFYTIDPQYADTIQVDISQNSVNGYRNQGESHYVMDGYRSAVSLCGGFLYNNTFNGGTNGIQNNCGKLYLSGNSYSNIGISAVNISGAVAYVKQCRFKGSAVGDLTVDNAAVYVDRCTMANAENFTSSSINNVSECDLSYNSPPCIVV